MPDVFATQKNIDASIYVPVNDVLRVGGVWVCTSLEARGEGHTMTIMRDHLEVDLPCSACVHFLRKVHIMCLRRYLINLFLLPTVKQILH